jgi:hypothetical protein
MGVFMAPSDETFLRRWARLKQTDQEPAPSVAAESAPVAAEEADAEELSAEELGLPDVDSLDKDSDYTGFLRDEVPEALKRKALRKLWLSDPVLANIDGLNDYDEDFSVLYEVAKKAIGGIAKLGDEGVEGAGEAAVDGAEATETQPPEPVTDEDEPEPAEADDDGETA